MIYTVKTPWWLRWYYNTLTWKIPVSGKELFLTFDDGPHEIATPFVLEQLKRFNAKATFFCIGKNVETYPEIYNSILSGGHAVGNHTQQHVNGWKTSDEEYTNNVKQASAVINSSLFRPPYGRIKKSQSWLLNKQYTIIMWDVLSGDFDVDLSPEACFQNVLKHTEPGSIIVFHDSQKAFDRLEYALPRVLEFFSEKGYTFSPISSL